MLKKLGISIVLIVLFALIGVAYSFKYEPLTIEDKLSALELKVESYHPSGK